MQSGLSQGRAGQGLGNGKTGESLEVGEVNTGELLVYRFASCIHLLLVSKNLHVLQSSPLGGSLNRETRKSIMRLTRGKMLSMCDDDRVGD
jgi:hypothetical protein